MSDVIFLSPHNDDETLFGAYTLMRRKPLAVVCTDCYTQSSDPSFPLVRRRETLKAMEVLGCEVEFLGIKDTELDEEILERALGRYNPIKVYAPLDNSKHPQHNLVGRVARKMWPGKVVFYSTYTTEDLTPRGEFPVCASTQEEELKVWALGCYESQIKVNLPHFNAVWGWNEFLNLENPPKVTAVLIKWKREEELKSIVQHLESVPFIDEVLIHTNTEEDNLMDYGRFVVAREAKNDIVFVQDDDYIISNIGELYATFDGEHMSNNIHVSRLNDYGPNSVHSVVGWGAFLKGEWIHLFDKYCEVYGEDNILRREAGRILTVLVNRERNTLPISYFSSVVPFPSSMDSGSLYRQPNHWMCKAIAIGRALELVGGS